MTSQVGDNLLEPPMGRPWEESRGDGPITDNAAVRLYFGRGWGTLTIDISFLTLTQNNSLKNRY